MSAESKNKLDEFEKLYPLLDAQNSSAEQAGLLIKLRDWYISLCDFDPLTNEPMPETMSQVVQKVSLALKTTKTLAESDDLFTQIINQCYLAIRAIIMHPKERVIREHDMVAITQVREVDNKSVQWLSRQSGRNLREKLSGKNHIYAVKRRASLNTAENRLFKACLERIETLLLLRLESQTISNDPQPEKHEDILQRIQAWLHLDDVKEIRSWDNLPPNNVLLSDRNYRKVWDSWQQLRDIDEAVQLDWLNIDAHYINTLWWSLINELRSRSDVRLLDQPCKFDYNNFKLNLPEQVQGRYFGSEKPQNIMLTEPKNNKFIISCSNTELTIQLSSSSVEVFEGDKKCQEKSKTIEGLSDFSYEVIKLLVGKEVLGTDTSFEQIKTNSAVLDISSWQSKLKPLGGPVVKHPLRFLTQFWPPESDGERFILEAGSSDALSTVHPIISCRHLWLEKKEADLVPAIEAYLNRLKSILDTKHLTYLVPDHVSEFATEDLRYRLNFAYPGASPLPKSIATLVSFKNSKTFEKKQMRVGDLFFVLDNCAQGIQITPVQAKYNKKLQDQSSQTNGISWERHPSFSVEGVTDVDLIKQALSNIQEGDSQIEINENFSQIFNFDELYESDGAFSLVKDDTWHDLPVLIREKLKKILPNEAFKQSDITEELDNFHKNLNDVYFISITASIKRPKWCKEENWIPFTDSLLLSAETLNKWQEQAPEAIFWRDHLPKLSTRTLVDGDFQDFYFVDDKTTVEPIRGKTINITISETFILPSGQPFYEFPLKMGKKQGKNGFLARLESDMFPSTEDIQCSLELTYTYGADRPYELKFIPNNPKLVGFKFLHSRWLPYEKVVKDIAPSYPEIFSWEEFGVFKGNKPGEVKDLYEWLTRDLDKIEGYCRFLIDGESPLRISLDLNDADRFTDKNNKHCAKYRHPVYGEIFIHESAYDDFDENLNIISCTLEKDRNGRNGYRGQEVTIGGKLPKRIRSSYRFPMLTMWNNGNNLTDINVPEDFKLKVQKTVKSVVEVLGNNSILDIISKDFKGDLRQFCCYLHKDMPSEVIDWLNKKSDKTEGLLRSNINKFGYVLSDLKCNWQSLLLGKILNGLNERKHRAGLLELLSISSWRHPDFILQLTFSDLSIISECLVDDITRLSGNLNSRSSDWNWSELLRKLELMLAVLRARDHEDRAVKALLTQDSKIIDKFTKVVELIINEHSKIIDSKLKSESSRVQSRVQFGDIKKSATFKGTPDLLYALRLYLTGEDGANLITITGVAD